MRIQGAIALVTGGAGGLGEGAARKLIEHGAKVALLDLDRSNGSEVAARIRCGDRVRPC